MTPQEILAAIQAFTVLEPEIQQGIMALIHLFHKHTVKPAPAPAEPAK